MNSSTASSSHAKDSIEREQNAIADSLRIRGAGPPVARVSRKALVVVGGLLSASLAGAIGWSLTQHPKSPPPTATDTPVAAPQRLAELPKDYLQRGPTPTMGPPLPGDLGRPILSAEAKGQEASPMEALPTSARADQSAPDPVVAERRAKLEAARSSSLFLPSSGRPLVADRPAPEPAPAAVDTRTTSPERLQAPASPYLLQAGAVIPAALVTGLRSDTPGLAVAQVTQDVFDSVGGRHRLIPAGARLIGEYAAQTSAGQVRLAVAWTRLILPTGRSIILDKLPGADAQGMAGLQDGVDRHWSQVWTAAAVSTVLAVGAEAGASDESDLVRAVRCGVSQSASDVGGQMVGRSLALAPTLTIRPGAPLRVLLSRDLVLEPYAVEASR